MIRYLFHLSPLRHVLNVWIILAVAICVKSAIMGGDDSVFRMFAGGSRHWWADQSLYAAYNISENLDSFRYSPTFAVAFTPFYLLRDPLGAIAWSLVSIALLVHALRVLARDGKGDKSNFCRDHASMVPASGPFRKIGLIPFSTHEAWFLGLVLVGSIVEIWTLQTNAVVTAMIALGLGAIVRQRWWAAAIFLAVPVFIKLWPIALVMLLVVFWPRQLSWRFAVVCAALAAVPFLTRPTGIVLWQYHEWYLDLIGPLQGRWPGYRDAWTVWEMLCSWFHSQADWNHAPARHVYVSIQLATSVAVLGWCLWQGRRRNGDKSNFSQRPERCFAQIGPVPFSTPYLLMLIFSMWAAWQLLFGPGTEQTTYGIIAPSASWAVLVSFAEKKARWLTVTAWAILALLPAGDIEKQLMNLLGQNAKAILPLGVVLFAAWLVWHESPHRKESAQRLEREEGEIYG